MVFTMNGKVIASDKVIASERLWLLIGYKVMASERCWPVKLGKDGTWMYSRKQVDGIVNGFGE